MECQKQVETRPQVIYPMQQQPNYKYQYNQQNQQFQPNQANFGPNQYYQSQNQGAQSHRFHKEYKSANQYRGKKVLFLY